MLAILLLICESVSTARAQESGIAETTLNSRNARIEQEDKIFLPLDKVDEVWEYVYNKYIVDPEGAKQLDPLFTTHHYDEQFADTYFDTPDLKLLSMKHGVRHRRRLNLTNPDDYKHGREAMQIKLSNVSSNPFERGEIKFDIEYPSELKHPFDSHPMLGIVKRSDRLAFIQELTKLGVDPVSMRPILTVHDLRRRIYFSHKTFSQHGTAFLSVSFDNASASIWWATTKFVEIEPELSEIEFTMADNQTRRYMEEINQKIIDDLKQRFPFLKTNLMPKYNKSFAYLTESLPFLPILVKTRMNNTEGMFMSLLSVFGAVSVGIFGAIYKVRQRKAYSVQSAAVQGEAVPKGA